MMMNKIKNKNFTQPMRRDNMQYKKKWASKIFPKITPQLVPCPVPKSLGLYCIHVTKAKH